jgi:signal transduction histidine kinase
MLAALTLAALVPAVCVLWFMSVAMRNERLAVQQRLTQVYLNHLTSVQRQVTTFWKERQTALESAAGASPSQVFATIVRSRLADSVILYDAAGRVAYPSPLPAISAASAEEPRGWEAARELEFQKTNYLAAAEAYGRIAESSANIHAQAQARQSQAGCLWKAGQKDQALQRLSELTGDSALRKVASAQGALIIPNVQLLLLKWIHDPSDKLFQQTASNLGERLNDYSDVELPASQRRFLMEELKSLSPEAASFPTLAAEQLAADYLELPSPIVAESKLQRGPVPGVWRVTLSGRARIALFREGELRQRMSVPMDTLALPGVKVTLAAPGESLPANHPGLVQEAGEILPGWRLALTFDGADPFLAASASQTRFYLWTGFLVVLIITVLAMLVARFVAAQMRLARLKNELVSTVSHELKTPLASMRALVDTLLARRYRDERQLENYLELVAKENQRLSHLIDNFLSFSRLEQGKQKFQFEEVKVGHIVNGALASLQDRLHSPLCRLDVEIAADLPAIRADPQALTTVLINLLDNAYKYTREDKHIVLRASRENGAVFLAVRDNGIGLSSREARNVFERFYQVDQSLTRRVGGCGLGLSIVQSIVKGHGGSIAVKSEPGQGSTFTVRLPIARG